MQLASGRPPSSQGDNFDVLYQGVCQKKAFAGTSVQATAFQKRTSVVRLIADHPCHVKIGLASDNSGAGPTAVGDGTCMYIAANVETRVGVPAGGSVLAVIEDGSTAGNLYIMEGA